jgi:hypothetical protein
MLLGDWAWDMSRVTEQDERLRAWVERRRGLVVLECGETPRLPELRSYVRRVVRDLGPPIVRISEGDCSVPEGGVGVPLGPRAALERIDARLRPGG